MTPGQWKRLMLTAVVLAVFTGNALAAQVGNTDESKRKVKTRVSPAYPELAKRMNVGGKVKIEVVITPDGHVRSTKVVGGHPLLVQVCQDAVKEWKFMPATEETTQIVEFSFTGSGT
jgi:TonB family protein